MNFSRLHHNLLSWKTLHFYVEILCWIVLRHICFPKEFDTGGILLNILAPRERQIFHDKTSIPKTTSRTIMKFMVNLLQRPLVLWSFSNPILRFKMNQNLEWTTVRTVGINCAGKQNKRKQETVNRKENRKQKWKKEQKRKQKRKRRKIKMKIKRKKKYDSEDSGY